MIGLCCLLSLGFQVSGWLLETEKKTYDWLSKVEWFCKPEADWLIKVTRCNNKLKDETGMAHYSPIT